MISYCPKSHTLYDGEIDLTKDKNYTFNFSERGLFTLLNRRGEPLYERALPLFNKVCSHILWILLWSLLIFLTNFFGPTTYLRITNPLFMGFIFFHLFILGIRLTALLLVGGLKPIFSPPLWVKLTNQFQKGAGYSLLEQHHLQSHPGLLANLALAKAIRGEEGESKSALEKALKLCPTHPALQALYHHLARYQFNLLNVAK